MSCLPMIEFGSSSHSPALSPSSCALRCRRSTASGRSRRMASTSYSSRWVARRVLRSKPFSCAIAEIEGRDIIASKEQCSLAILPARPRLYISEDALETSSNCGKDHFCCSRRVSFNAVLFVINEEIRYTCKLEFICNLLCDSSAIYGWFLDDDC